LKSEIYQNNIRDTTNSGLGPTSNTNSGLGPTSNTNSGLGPTSNTNSGFKAIDDSTTSSGDNPYKNSTTSGGDNPYKNDTASSGDNSLKAVNLFSNRNEYSKLLDNLPAATIAEGLPNSKVEGQAGLLSLLPETTGLGQEAQPEAAPLPLSSPPFEREEAELQPLLDEQTRDKRLTTFPEYLQGEQATEAGQEEAGDLDTETTFFRDILETDESEGGASTPEEESDLEEEPEGEAAAPEGELELEEEPEEESVKSINLENDDDDSKDNDDDED
jgi:hypothetical protein